LLGGLSEASGYQQNQGARKGATHKNNPVKEDNVPAKEVAVEVHPLSSFWFPKEFRKKAFGPTENRGKKKK